MKKMLGIALAGAVALVMTACGSSDDNGSPATATPSGSTSDIPASALADSTGLLAYVNAQIAASSDTSEPVLVGDATALPVDDTTETSL
ncbi:MAG: hypothetical protein M3150_02410 [Pseudomonadota bacterium]|nr:hypothetical protein [Pseudomonadota bacterium]